MLNTHYLHHRMGLIPTFFHLGLQANFTPSTLGNSNPSKLSYNLLLNSYILTPLCSKWDQTLRRIFLGHTRKFTFFTAGLDQPFSISLNIPVSNTLSNPFLASSAFLPGHVLYKYKLLLLL